MPRRQHPQRQQQSALLADTYIALSKDPGIWQGSLVSGLRQITRACVNAVGVQRASIWSVSDDFSALTCLSLYREDTDRHEQGMTLQANQYPRYFSALASDRVIAANDALTDPRTREFAEVYLKPLNITSMLDGTLRSEGKTRGVVCLEEVGSARLWTADEQTFVASIADLVAQLILLNTLRESESRYRALFDGSGDGIFVVRDGTFIDCNATALNMFRATREQIIGQSPLEFSTPTQADGTDSGSKSQRKIRAALESGPQFFEWRHRRLDGSTFDAEVTLNAVTLNDKLCVIGSVRDISDRKQAEQALVHSRQQLEHRAYHDALTGLPNRECLHERALGAIAQAEQRSQKVAFLLLDLNRFKDVNDTLGHTIGDHLLTQIAARLQGVLDRQQAELFRLGGDEFAVMARTMRDENAALELARTIGSSLRQPVVVEGISLELGASIGIALFPHHGHNSHAMLRCADVAMYQAKTHGTGIVVYSPEFDSHSPRRLMMMAELGTAIREDQLRLHFQPRIDIRSGQCTGCEALLRWQHPTQGMVPPGDFIPIAEMSDVIHPLSLWVIRNAVDHIRRWRERGIDMAVAINLSARNLTDLQCAQRIAELLTEYDIHHHLLEIEITESALISDPKRALAVVDSLHQLGLKLAIDDFGTGYSSLSYLKRLPISTLKIDRSFVKDMLTNEADAVIVRSTIGLAHSFGLNVVAEGVEDEATLLALGNLQCDQAQGYFIARPLPAEEFDQWLAGRSRH